MYKCECVRCGWTITNDDREEIIQIIKEGGGEYKEYEYSECPSCMLDGLDISLIPELNLSESFKPIKCKDCNEEFYIADGERKFFESKGLNLPVRCHFCRDKRKNYAR